MIQTVRECLQLLEGTKRQRWVVLVVLGVASSAVEAIGALLIFAVLGLLQDPKASVDLPIVGNLRDRFPGLQPDKLFVIVAIVTATFFVARAGVLLAQVYVQHRVAQNAGARLASRLLTGYLAEPYEEHTQRNSAVLIRNIHDSVHSVIAWTLTPLLTIASEALMVAGVVGVLLLTAPMVTLVGAMFLGVQVLLLLRGIRPRMSRLGETSQAMAAATLQSLQQSLHGFRDVRLSGRSANFVGRFNDERTLFARVQYVQAALVTLPRLLVETMFVLGLVAFMLVVRGDGVDEQTMALLGLFAYSVLRVMPSVNRIVVSLGQMRFGGAAVDELHAELDRLEAQPRQLEGGVRRPFRESVTARGLHYRHPGAATEALRGVDVTVRRGAYVGIVGATGSGKSTLVDVLIGLLSPSEGTVLVDGEPVAGHEADWQRAIGVVPQTVFLIDDTLRANVAFGVPADQADDAAVRRAVDQAQLRELVDRLPAGLDTVVGERGVRLSGGQRQRVAIARALYDDPDVLFFDEGTASLDTLTEAEVMRALESLRGERTIVAVAHRLSTVRSCDHIYLLTDGVVADEGTYEELLQRSEAFRRMTG